METGAESLPLSTPVPGRADESGHDVLGADRAIGADLDRGGHLHNCAGMAGALHLPAMEGPGAGVGRRLAEVNRYSGGDREAAGGGGAGASDGDAVLGVAHRYATPDR